MTVTTTLAQLLPDQVRNRLAYRHGLRIGERDLVLVRDALARGDHFVDVGANNGMYVAAALTRRARVTAVEPLPGHAAALRTRFPTATVHEGAIAPEAGTATLHIPVTSAGREIATRASLRDDANPGHDDVAITVATVPLDDLVPSADFVKIDVEGLELAVLASAERLLGSSSPTLLVEIEARHAPGDPGAAFDHLAARGYLGGWVHPDRDRAIRALADFDFAVHQDLAHAKSPDDPGHSGLYVNNFVFVHPRRLGPVTARLSRRGWSLPWAG